MQNDTLILITIVSIVCLIIITGTTVYILKQKLKANNINNISREYFNDQVDEIEWEYDRKCMAYKILLSTTLITALCFAVSLYIYFSGNKFYIFHIATLVSLIMTTYYNYLNREALLQPIQSKRL
ncbi:hypothetical protein [Sulfurimonas sp.]|uniref:hypothetical protein n=1 Tax=Sulfurimonas sp. TaxID=2022749 RepID=UPI003569DF16